MQQAKQKPLSNPLASIVQAGQRFQQRTKAYIYGIICAITWMGSTSSSGHEKAAEIDTPLTRVSVTVSSKSYAVGI